MNKDPSLRARQVAVPLIVALGITGCGGSGRSSQTVTATETVTTPAEPSHARIKNPHEIPVTFDDLGGGSSVIKVYNGPGNTEADRQYNGTFEDGQKAPAICKTTGREVESDPSVGEQKRGSDKWVGLEGGVKGEVEWYATTVYLEHPKQILRAIKKHCPPTPAK